MATGKLAKRQIKEKNICAVEICHHNDGSVESGKARRTGDVIASSLCGSPANAGSNPIPVEVDLLYTAKVLYIHHKKRTKMLNMENSPSLVPNRGLDPPVIIHEMSFFSVIRPSQSRRETLLKLKFSV